MPKTRRTKRNGKAPLKSRNIVLTRIGTFPLVDKPGRTRRHPKGAGPIDVTVFSGDNRGKVYPYAGKKRGGRGGAMLSLHAATRRNVAVVG